MADPASQSRPSKEPPADLHEFQAYHAIDDRSFKGLSDLSPQDQIVVMDAVNAQSCKNPSAVTWAMVRQVQAQPHGIRLEYVRRHLDERCLEGLMKLPVEAQEYVASQVDPCKVKNLSAFVWAQIKLVSSGGCASGGRSGLSLGPMLPPMMPMLFPFPAFAPLPLKELPTPAGWKWGTPRASASLAGNVQPRERSRSPLPGSPGGGYAGCGGMAGGWAGGGADPVLEEFIVCAGIDQNAAQALRDLDPESRRIAVGLSSSQTARNPSAVAWSMVKLVREKPLQAKLEYLRSALDEEANLALNNLSAWEREAILASVDIGNCRNLSAFIWSRVKASVGPGAKRKGFGSSKDEDHAGFDGVSGDGPDPYDVAGVKLDSWCSKELRTLSYAEQQRILSEVDAGRCRNPSAFVWSAIKRVRGGS